MLLQHIWYVGFWTKSTLMNSVLVSTVITRLKIHYSNTLFRCLLHTISTHKRQQTFKTKKKKSTTSAPSVVQINQVKYSIQPNIMVCHMLKLSRLNSKMAPSLERSNPCIYRSQEKEQWARTKHLSPTTRVACHNGTDVGSGSYF